MTDNKILVAVPDFATLDEILAGLALTVLLQKSQKDVRLYLGLQNISKKLQIHIPQLSEVKIYEPNHQPNEMIINIPISDNKVNKVKWEQENDDLKIHIETSKNIEKSLPINVKGKTNFSQLFLINAASIDDVFDGDLLKAHSDFSNCETTKILDNSHDLQNTQKEPSTKIVQDRNFPSICELLCKFLEEENFDFQSVDENTAKLLMSGAKNSRISQNKSFKNLVGPLKQIPYKKTIFFHLSESEFQKINNFWSYDQKEYKSTNKDKPTNAKNPSQDLPLNAFETLLKITPQLNIFNFLNKKYLQKNKITRSAQESLFVTNDFDLKKSFNKSKSGAISSRNISSRNFGKYEIIRLENETPKEPQKIKKTQRIQKAATPPLSPKKPQKTDIFQEI